jgi:hypothetical protein
MDFFQSRKLCPSRCYLTFFHFPERSIALVKRLAGSKGAEIDPTCLHANKVLLQGTRILIYIDGLLSVAQTVPNRCYLTFFHFPERSIALVKRLVHQRAEIDPNLPHANKVLLRYAFLYTLMDFFQSHKLCPSRCYLTFFHFPERSIASKRLAGSPKIDPNLPHANKVLLQGSTRIYTLMDFQSHQTVPKPLLSYLLPFSQTFNCTSKTTGWFTKG